MLIYNEKKVGDLRKTMSVWMDLNPMNVTIIAKKESIRK
jgi:hypothetical protein